MKRIDSVNARPDENGLGKAGFNDNADLPGQDATYVTPDWFNTVQEELCNLLELRGITLDPNSKRQLYDLLSSQADLEALADAIEVGFIRKNQIVNNLTTNDPANPISAAQAKSLQDKKIDRDEAIALLGFLPYMPIPYPKSTPPDGYLMMMGQAISQATYPILYGLFGSTLPDMRGEFIRGWDNGRGVDVGRALLSKQGDAIRNITGKVDSIRLGLGWTPTGTGAFTAKKEVNSGDANAGSSATMSFDFDASRQVPVASENRPSNVAFNYIVKAG